MSGKPATRRDTAILVAATVAIAIAFFLFDAERFSRRNLVREPRVEVAVDAPTARPDVPDAAGPAASAQ